MRKEMLKGIAGARIAARIFADEAGIAAETRAAVVVAEDLGLSVVTVMGEGAPVSAGQCMLEFEGHPEQVAKAEEVLIGTMAKPSGIATAARRFVDRAGGKPEIVCGAWKKMPPADKEPIRRAITAGGARFRICEEPFIYLDKNYLEMLGGIEPSLEAVASQNGRHLRVVQLKGRYADISDESCQAGGAGAAILSIDTGRFEDIEAVSSSLTSRGLRGRVRIAFAGGVRLEDIDALKAMDVDIVDVGREIVDAPLLDMRMEVVSVDG